MPSSHVFNRVPVIDVSQENFKEIWPSLSLAVKSATFIGMDLELSGLGNRKRLNARDIDDRYSVMADVAKTRSVLSLGLSCFKLNDVGKLEVKAAEGEPGSPTRSKVNWKFHVQTFNILVLCTDDFIVEPITLKFLLDHGFDFNKQYSKGIPYYRGNDKPQEEDSPSLRQLMSLLVLSKTPVVFHNALVDLVFLYQSFYATLPPNLTMFTSDLTQVFEGGVFDTKYITEYMDRMPASYLEYVFRRCQRNNSISMAHVNHMVSLEFFDYPESYTYITYCRCDLPTTMVEKGDNSDTTDLESRLCDQYAGFGWCQNGSSCPKSHDIDEIIDMDGLKPAKKCQKRKRRKQKQNNSSESEEQTETTQSEAMDHNSDENVSPEKKARVTSPGEKGEKTCANGDGEKDKKIVKKESSNTNDLGIARKEGHRAGYDAFMTGYILATYAAKYGRLPEEKRRNLKLSELNLSDMKNMVYLCGKDIPMVITKSAFSKNSKDHRDKIAKITG